ncbi:unnamed protein product [Closterium sp. NIES-53]
MSLVRGGVGVRSKGSNKVLVCQNLEEVEVPQPPSSGTPVGTDGGPHPSSVVSAPPESPPAVPSSSTRKASQPPPGVA